MDGAAFGAGGGASSHALTGEAAARYWGRPNLGERILAALQQAGKNLDALTPDDLAPLDQFHGGGKPATLALARRAHLQPGTRVLDVGGGLGGPARTLAVEYGCDVTVVDPTPEYRQAGELLTERLRLQERVRFVAGEALALPVADGAYDVVWTQNSGMQIADKPALYGELARATRAGGMLVTQEPVAGEVQPPYYPLMWAADSSTNHLLPAAELLAVILAAGFRTVDWDTVTFVPPPNDGNVSTIQDLVMGERAAAIADASARNRREGRIAYVQGVFLRP